MNNEWKITLDGVMLIAAALKEHACSAYHDLSSLNQFIEKATSSINRWDDPVLVLSQYSSKTRVELTIKLPRSAFKHPRMD